MSNTEQSDAGTCEGASDMGSDGAGASRHSLAGRATTPRFLTVCAWCEHVKLGRRWLPMEEVVRRLHMVELLERPLLTHGICPTCLEPLIARRTVPETTARKSRAA